MLNIGCNIVKLCYTVLLVAFSSLFMSKIKVLSEKGLKKDITKL